MAGSITDGGRGAVEGATLGRAALGGAADVPTAGGGTVPLVSMTNS